MNYPKLGLSISSIKDAGFGLIALEPIKKGQLIGKYLGENVNMLSDKVQYDKRSLYKELKAPSYLFDLQFNGKDHGFIDA